MQDYKTIRSVEEIDAYLGNATVVAFDFETAATDEYRDEEWSALDAHKSEIAGISVSVAAGTARYIPLRHRVGQNADVESVMAYLRSRLFNSSRIVKIAHNLSFEAMFLYKYGIVIQEPVYDTIVAAQLMLWRESASVLCTQLLQLIRGHMFFNCDNKSNSFGV